MKEHSIKLFTENSLSFRYYLSHNTDSLSGKTYAGLNGNYIVKETEGNVLATLNNPFLNCTLIFKSKNDFEFFRKNILILKGQDHQTLCFSVTTQDKSIIDSFFSENSNMLISEPNTEAFIFEFPLINRYVVLIQISETTQDAILVETLEEAKSWYENALN